MNRKNFFKTLAATITGIAVSPSIIAEAVKDKKPLTLVYEKVHLRNGTTLNVGYYKEQWEHFDRMTNTSGEKLRTSYNAFVLDLTEQQ